LWSGSVGIGSTSPLVVDGRLYTMGWRDSKDTVYCLDAATGKVFWQTSYNCPLYGRYAVGDQGLYGGPTATPEYDKETGFLYTLSVDGDLHCWDTRSNGRKVWVLNLYDRYGVGQRPIATKGRATLRDYGYTSAPLVYRNWLIVEVGDDEGNLMAFDKRNGERQWVSQNKDPAGHTGGSALMTVEGVPCVAVLTLKGLLVARLDKGNAGKTVAEYAWTTDYAQNIPTPAIHENYVLITSKYNRNTLCKLKITLRDATKIWEQPYASGVCSPVIYKGHIYWASRGLMCLDFATGELKWHGGRFGDTASCIATGDGRLIVWANEGDLALVETAERASGEYMELSQKKGLFNTEVWPHVVLANGRFYCKDRNGHVKCFPL
jgi:outer membrane protein assembly factor BamB